MSYDQSSVNVRNASFDGAGASFSVYCYDSSVGKVENITAGVGVNSEVYAYDLSTVDIVNSTITLCGFAVQSTGTMSVTNGLLGGSYVNTTKWDSEPQSIYLNSIAVKGRDTLNVKSCNFNASVYVHNEADVQIEDTVFKYSSNGSVLLCVYDTSKVTAYNTSFQNVTVYAQSSVSLTNVTINQTLAVGGSATVSCTGTPSSPTTINAVSATSNFPNLANIEFNKCTVQKITGTHWIVFPGATEDIMRIILYYYAWNAFQPQLLSTNLALPMGIIGVALAIAVFFLAKRQT